MKGKISFNSKIENLNKAEIILKKIASKISLSEQDYGYILLALSEAINNAIVHGNKLDLNKKIFVSYYADKTQIELSVQDEGEGFDPDAVPDPTSPENIEKATGRGLFIIKNLADKVSFEKNGRKITMKFYINR